jgi:hypothetical protein
VIATVPVGQAPQALTYVCNAVPSGSGTQNLQSLGVAGQVALRQYASVLLVPLDDEDGFIINAVLLALWRNSSSLLRA